MHPEAHAALAKMVADSGVDAMAPLLALDLGGANYNGTGRGRFPRAEWIGLDLRPGSGVDIVADAATWTPDRAYDVVVSTELLEHAREWRACLHTAWAALRPGGLLFVTCASTGRPVHSHSGLAELAEGEHYGNVAPDQLAAALEEFPERHVTYAEAAGDVYAWARR